MNDFDLCQQYIKTIAENLKAQGSSARRVAKLSYASDGEDKKKKKKKKKHEMKIGREQARIRTSHYDKEEWRTLSADEKNQVAILRKNKKAQKRTVSVISTDTEESVSPPGTADPLAAPEGKASSGDDAERTPTEQPPKKVARKDKGLKRSSEIGAQAKVFCRSKGKKRQRPSATSKRTLQVFNLGARLMLMRRPLPRRAANMDPERMPLEVNDGVCRRRKLTLIQSE